MKKKFIDLMHQIDMLLIENIDTINGNQVESISIKFGEKGMNTVFQYTE